jgi:molybdopterin synthase catalytic subunit
MIRLAPGPFDAGAELNAFRQGRRESGAVVSFLGIARGEGGAATAVELDAYPAFSLARIEAIAAEAVTRFHLHDVAVIHRIGRIAAGEEIVLAMTAAAHRREAFEACDFLMDYLKSRAPFWKKEHGPSGSRWIEPTERDLKDVARWDEG